VKLGPWVPHWVSRVLPNDSDGVDDAMAAMSAPPFGVPTTRTLAFRRFADRGGDGHRCISAPPGLGGGGTLKGIVVTLI
jgi:hypothetical protein